MYNTKTVEVPELIQTYSLIEYLNLILKEKVFEFKVGI